MIEGGHIHPRSLVLHLEESPANTHVAVRELQARRNLFVANANTIQRGASRSAAAVAAV